MPCPSVLAAEMLAIFNTNVLTTSLAMLQYDFELVELSNPKIPKSGSKSKSKDKAEL